MANDWGARGGGGRKAGISCIPPLSEQAGPPSVPLLELTSQSLPVGTEFLSPPCHDCTHMNHLLNPDLQDAKAAPAVHLPPAPQHSTSLSLGVSSFINWSGTTSPDGTRGKESTCQCRRHKIRVRSLGWEDPLE